MWVGLFAALLGVGCPGRVTPGPLPSVSGVVPPADADLLYFILVDRFANGDPSNDGIVDPTDPQAFHGGDLTGVRQHLDELQALGVRTVWLSPVFDSRTEKFFSWGAFHGYWVEDPYAIEPRFGTEADLAALSDDLHARGMRLYLDVVFNHVAMDAPLTRERPEWFHHHGAITDWNDPFQLVNHEVHGLPDLAQEVPEAYAWLLGAARKWVRVARPDGFRIDAVRHMPVEFLARFAADIRATAGPQFVLLGEDFQGDPVGLARSFREGGFGAMFDFPLHYAMMDVFCDGRPVGRLGAILSADAAYPDASRLVTFLDNHDLPRVSTRCADLVRVEDALRFQFASRGTPCITWGTEAALAGAGEPENRQDMKFGGQQPLRAILTSLADQRRAHPSLVRGGTRVLALTETGMVLARHTPQEVALVAVNRADTPLSLPPLTWVPADVQVTTAAGEAVGAGVRLAAAPESVSTWYLTSATGFRDPFGPGRDREVEVILTGVPTRPADLVRLVGTGSALGNWDPGAGIPPRTGDPRGLVFPLRFPVGTVLELKVVISRPDGNVSWQAGENRYLLVEAGEGVQEQIIPW